MKKKYIKPDVVFESFELTSAVAADCSVIGSPSAAYVCPVVDDELGITIFTSTSGCQYSAPGVNDRVCYDVPFAGLTVFES